MPRPEPDAQTLDQLFSEPDVAARYDRSPRTLQRWRHAGTGPAWLQIGGSIFYRIEDVLAFEARSRRGGTK
jgi:hypothetical protein